MSGCWACSAPYWFTEFLLDWQILCLLLQVLQKQSKSREIPSFPAFDQCKEIIGSLVDLIPYLMIVKCPLGFCISSSSSHRSSVRILRASVRPADLKILETLKTGKHKLLLVCLSSPLLFMIAGVFSQQPVWLAQQKSDQTLTKASESIC